jgi:plastocyanin domain-containing protein
MDCRISFTLLGIIVALAGCQRSAPAAEQDPTVAASSTAGAPIAIRVDGRGYHPDVLRAPAGKPVQLVFTRVTEQGCAEELVFPSLSIRKLLPVNQPVTVEFTMPASGKVAFTCGMDMLHGSVEAY